MPQTTILILAANPKSTTTLRLDQEVRDITEALKRSQYRDTFNLQSRWAVRPRDLQLALLELQPQIVHFCGHGTETEGLAFEDDSGNITLASTVALAQTFSLFQDSIQCVLLNACYSANQAEAIAQHIPYVIGMNQAIKDQAAITFAISFYDAIGAGRDIPFAFNLAKNAIQLAGIPEHLIPMLLSTQAPPTQPKIAIISKLTPGQRQRLQKRQTTLQDEWERRSQKLPKLRQSSAIETDAARLFQINQQITNEETQLTELEAELDRIEQTLNS